MPQERGFLQKNWALILVVVLVVLGAVVAFVLLQGGKKNNTNNNSSSSSVNDQIFSEMDPRAVQQRMQQMRGAPQKRVRFADEEDSMYAGAPEQAQAANLTPEEANDPNFEPL